MAVGASYGRSSTEGIKFPTVPHRKSTGFGSIGINFPVVKGIVNVGTPREAMTGMTRHKVPPGEPDRNTWQEWSMYHTPQKRHDDKSSIPL